MFDLARLARHPALAGYFAHVHPFFWPVLLWYLRKVAAQVDAAGRDNALIRITWWGGVYLEYLGDRADAWKRPALTKPAWSDPVWETHLPPNMSVLLLEVPQTNNLPQVSMQAGTSPEAHLKRSRRMGGLTPNTS